MSINNTLILDRQRQPDQVADEVERLHEEWRGACRQLTAERERQAALRAALAEQDALVARLTSSERTLRTTINMRTVLARLPFPPREQPAVEATGPCRPVEILGCEDDDGGRYAFRADGSYPDVFRIFDKRLRSYAHVGSDEAAARTRLADLRAAETPAEGRLRTILSSLTTRARSIFG